MQDDSPRVENDSTAANVQDQTPPEINTELMHDLQVLVDRLASKSNRLINNFTTNIAENWMHVRCKFDGGKYPMSHALDTAHLFLQKVNLRLKWIILVLRVTRASTKVDIPFASQTYVLH